jgi:hypothetical protein
MSSDTDNYPMVAKVYLRQKNFPYNVLSKGDTYETFELYKFERTKSFEMTLDGNLVQTDLPNYAELVFDFSDMVQNIYYDADSSLKSSQQAFGPWYGAIITLTDIKINTRCSNPISASQV